MTLEEEIDFIEQFANQRINNLNHEDWATVCSIYYLSETFMRTFAEKLEWNKVSLYQKISESFFLDYKNHIAKYHLAKNKHLKIDFVRKFKDDLEWCSLSSNFMMTEDNIEEFKDYIIWMNVSAYQHLSEDFIRRHKDDVHWQNILIHQELSYEFLKEFGDKIRWAHIENNEKITKETKDKLAWRHDPNYKPHTHAEYYDGTLIAGYEKDGVFFFNNGDCDLVENLKLRRIETEDLIGVFEFASGYQLLNYSFGPTAIMYPSNSFYINWGIYSRTDKYKQENLYERMFEIRKKYRLAVTKEIFM